MVKLNFLGLRFMFYKFKNITQILRLKKLDVIVENLIVNYLSLYRITQTKQNYKLIFQKIMITRKEIQRS